MEPEPFRFRDEQWQRACATIREPVPSADVLRAARGALEDAATNFLEGVALADKRARRAENRRLLERMRRIADKLHGYADLRKHVSDDLAATGETVGRHSGTQNPQRQMLYDLALSIWTEKFGQKASVSRPSEVNVSREPGGPTIRFLEAVLGPIMGDHTPKAEGLRKIIIKYEPARVANARSISALAALAKNRK